MGSRWSLLITVVVLLVGTGRDAAADHSRIANAQRAYDELRFGDVLNEVAAARREGGLGHDDAIELTRLEAYTYSVYEDRAHAIDAFDRLLTLDPGFVPQGVSPKITAYFDEARRQRTKPVTVVTGAPPVTSAPPPEASHRSVARSPWLWGGAAVIVGIAVVGVWLTARGDDAKSGDLGTIQLP